MSLSHDSLVRVERTYRDRVNLVSAMLVSITTRTLMMILTLSLRRAMTSVATLSPNPYVGPKLPLVLPAEMKQMIQIEHFSHEDHGCWPRIANSPAQIYCAAIWEIASSNWPGLSVTEGSALDCVADVTMFIVAFMPNNDIVYLCRTSRTQTGW